MSVIKRARSAGGESSQAHDETGSAQIDQHKSFLRQMRATKIMVAVPPGGNIAAAVAAAVGDAGLALCRRSPALQRPVRSSLHSAAASWQQADGERPTNDDDERRKQRPFTSEEVRPTQPHQAVSSQLTTKERLRCDDVFSSRPTAAMPSAAAVGATRVFALRCRQGCHASNRQIPLFVFFLATAALKQGVAETILHSAPVEAVKSAVGGAAEWVGQKARAGQT